MKITPEAVKERIAALESAGELSLKEQFYLEALRQLVATMGSCTWHCEEDINNWHSDCGYQFQFMEDGPEENGVKFCPKCGKSVAVSATEGTEE